MNASSPVKLSSQQCLFVSRLKLYRHHELLESSMMASSALDLWTWGSCRTCRACLLWHGRSPKHPRPIADFKPITKCSSSPHLAKHFHRAEEGFFFVMVPHADAIHKVDLVPICVQGKHWTYLSPLTYPSRAVTLLLGSSRCPCCMTHSTFCCLEVTSNAGGVLRTPTCWSSWIRSKWDQRLTGVVHIDLEELVLCGGWSLQEPGSRGIVCACHADGYHDDSAHWEAIGQQAVSVKAPGLWLHETLTSGPTGWRICRPRICWTPQQIQM